MSKGLQKVLAFAIIKIDKYCTYINAMTKLAYIDRSRIV